MDTKQDTMGPIKVIHHSIPIDILDDLCSRFLINVPAEERTDLVRLCFQIELAHWFYLDFYCTDESTNVNPCGMKDFSAHIFQHIPYLQKHRHNLENILDNWREYKQSVPTFGAIILNEDLTHVLLVQSFWTKASWGFPKGKVNEDEEPWHCASREVLEETGFDITNLINKNDFIESLIHEQAVRLYIITNVPQSTTFIPRTRNEIKACEWFPIADLPSNRKDMTPKLKMGVSPNAFFMVLPFVKRLKRWVAERIQKTNSNSKRLRHKSMGDIEASTGKPKPKVISQGLQKEITEYQQSHSNYKPKNNSNQKVTNNSGKKEKKGNFKRQLFVNNNYNSSNQLLSNNRPSTSNQYSNTNIQEIDKSSVSTIANECSFNNFFAKSWNNFKFDRKAIWDSMA